MLLIGIFAAAWTGFALIALSQERHWKRVGAVARAKSASAGDLSMPYAPAPSLRIAGGASLAVSLVLCFLRDGASFGAILWVSALTLAALAVALMLAYAPAALSPLASSFVQSQGSEDRG
ncbi:MAG: DUF3325 family protein [Pseudomonadota bacterium]